MWQDGPARTDANDACARCAPSPRHVGQPSRGPRGEPPPARPNVGQLSRGRGQPPPARPKHHRRVASAPYPLIKTTPQRRRSLSEADLEVALPPAEPEKVRRRPDRGALPVVAALTLCVLVATKAQHKIAAVQQHRTVRRLVEVEAHAAPTTDPRAVEARAARCADVKCASPSLDVVFASCDDEAGLRVAKALVKMREISCCARFFVYEKCTDEATLQNVGREQHTYLHHVVKNFDDLAEHVLFAPSNLERPLNDAEYKGHSQKPAVRRDFLLQNLVKMPSLSCAAAPNKTLGDASDFVKIRHNGRRLDQAAPRGLRAWALSHLGAFVSTAPLCRGGVVFTTGSRLRSRPKEFYEHLRDTLRGMEPEAGHYLERLAQLAFGGVEAAASS